MNDLDLAAIGKGALAGMAIGTPARVVADKIGEGSSVRGLMILMIIVAFVVAGFLAGRARPLRAITHGAIAGLLAAVPVLIAGIALTGKVGVSVIFSPLFGASCGILGGYIAFRRADSAGAGPGAVAP